MKKLGQILKKMEIGVINVYKLLIINQKYYKIGNAFCTKVDWADRCKESYVRIIIVKTTLYSCSLRSTIVQFMRHNQY